MPDGPGEAKSTERVRRWRQRHPERNRELQRVYEARYNSTEKGRVRDHRYEASAKGWETKRRFKLKGTRERILAQLEALEEEAEALASNHWQQRRG